MVKKRVIESVTSDDAKSKRWKSLFAAARMAYDSGELRQAESLLARARELAHELPEHSFAGHSTEIAVAVIDLAKRKPRDAASRLQKSINKLEAPVDDAHKELFAVALRFHAQALEEMKDLTEAEKELKKSAAVLEELGATAAVQLAYTFCDLAALYLVQGRLSEAQKYINNAMELLFTVLGPDSPEYTRADMIYAACMFPDAEGREAMVQDGIGKMEYMFGKNHPNITRALDRYVKVLTEKGDKTRLDDVKERFCIKSKSGK